MSTNSNPYAEIWIEVKQPDGTRRRTDECSDGKSTIAILEYDERELTPYIVGIRLKRPINPRSKYWGYKFYLDGKQNPTGG